MENVDIFALIDELQEEIELAKTCGLSKNKQVDPQIMFEIIADIRKALEDTLQYAKEIEGGKDHVLSSANAQADTIIKEAQAHAQELVSESAIVRSAQEQALKVVEKTKQKTADMKRMSVEYAEEVFADLEEYYKDAMELLRENASRLQNKKEK